MKIKPAFYGRPLVPMGFMWSLSLGKGATVICWSAYAQPKRLKTGLEPSKRMWLAKIVGFATWLRHHRGARTNAQRGAPEAGEGDDLEATRYASSVQRSFSTCSSSQSSYP